MGLVVVISNFLVQFPIHHLGLEEILTYGAFSYPITFLITDLANRAYGKIVAKKIFSNVYDKGFVHDVEVALISKKLKYKIKELPVKWLSLIHI